MSVAENLKMLTLHFAACEGMISVEHKRALLCKYGLCNHSHYKGRGGYKKGAIIRVLHWAESTEQ